MWRDLNRDGAADRGPIAVSAAVEQLRAAIQAKEATSTLSQRNDLVLVLDAIETPDLVMTPVINTVS